MVYNDACSLVSLTPTATSTRLPAMGFGRKLTIADGVIFAGMAINLVVVLLILYFFVL